MTYEYGPTSLAVNVRQLAAKYKREDGLVDIVRSLLQPTGWQSLSVAARLRALEKLVMFFVNDLVRRREHDDMQTLIAKWGRFKAWYANHGNHVYGHASPFNKTKRKRGRSNANATPPTRRTKQGRMNRTAHTLNSVPTHVWFSTIGRHFDEEAVMSLMRAYPGSKSVQHAFVPVVDEAYTIYLRMAHLFFLQPTASKALRSFQRHFSPEDVYVMHEGAPYATIDVFGDAFFYIRVLFNQHDYKKSKFIMYPMASQSSKFHWRTAGEDNLNEDDRIEWTWRNGKLHTEVYRHKKLQLAYNHAIIKGSWAV